MQTIKRPWQGTALGVLNIIGLVLLAATLIFVFTIVGSTIVGSTILDTAANKSNFIGALLEYKFIILIPIALLYILGVLITIGIFNGQKWAIIVSLAFSIIGAISEVEVISLLISALVIYLEIYCLKHPFYGKKIIQNKSQTTH